MMHGKTNHVFCHSVCLRKVLLRRTRETPIGAKRADERIEITSPKHVIVFHLKIEFIPGHPKFLGINKDREIGVVMTDAWHIIKEGDAFNVAKSLPISDGDLMPSFDGGINLF